MIKVYVIGGLKHYANWLIDVKHVNSIKEADLVMGTGGEDWSPSYYGENKGSRTDCNPKRDWFEWEAFKQARGLDKPIVGICRSSQGLCAFAGGRLVQHQLNPYFLHPIHTYDDKTFHITSTHHQAQFPYNLPESDYKLLAWTNGLSNIHLDGEDKEIQKTPFKEAEVVFYPKIKALAIQGHPEYEQMESYLETLYWLRGLTFDLISEKLYGDTGGQFGYYSK